jgi:uncharacterized protein YdaT
MQATAAKAWEATRIQKLINMLTLITTLHNAAMISADIGETLGYVVSNALGLIGIKDEDGNDLDISTMVGDNIKSFIENAVGTEAYNATISAWQKSNRVLRAASSIVWTVRSITDTTQDVLEWTAENTGKIGNALRKYGVVGERAYPVMSERVKAQEFYRNKFSRLINGLENVEDTASSIAQVSGDVREISQEVAELGQNRAEFVAAVADASPDLIPTSAPENVPLADRETAANAVSISPEITTSDIPRNESP